MSLVPHPTAPRYSAATNALERAERVRASLISAANPFMLQRLLWACHHIRMFMRLYFLRHADALEGEDDAARPLSAKGEKDSRRMAEFLHRAGIAFDAAYTSPLVRARQTAEIVVKVCGAVNKPLLDPALTNQTSTPAFQRWLKGLAPAGHVLLSGHAPSMPEHVCKLLGLEPDVAFRLPKGAVACVETDDGTRGLLKFFVTPKILGRSG